MTGRFVRWLVVGAAAWLIAGPWAAVSVVAAASLAIGGWFSAKALLSASVILMALVPLFWLAGNLDDLGGISNDLVTSTPMPNHIAVMALCFAVVGLTFDLDGRPPHD